MNLGEYIAAYRREHNLSIREFAKLCKLSHVQIIRMETGLNSKGNPFIPTVKSLKAVADGTGITFGELLSYCDENMTVRVDKDDLEYKPPKERQDIIDKIILATPEQFALIQSYVDFVTK